MINGVILLRPLGVDLFCTGKKFLIYNLVGRNLKIKYRRSIAGFFWTILNPLASTTLFYFVFKVILNIQVPHYLAFILSGMLPWAFFSQTFMESMESIVGNWGILTKVPIPVQAFPLVGTLTNWVSLFFSLPILLGSALLSGVSLSSSIVLIPFFLLSLFLMTYGLSLIVAIAFVYLRDLRHIMGIVLQLWFYATPIIYNESMIPQKFHWILFLNPLGMTFCSFHEILVRGSWPKLMELGITFSWTFVIITAAILVRKYLCDDLVEQL